MARRASILYATSGHLTYETMLGTNQVWISLGLAVSALLLLKNRSSSSGIVQALTASTTKFLAVLFWPVLWICAPRRTHWLIGTFLLVAIYAVFAIGGGDILYPIRYEGGAISSGNLPYLLAPLLDAAGLTNPHLFDGAALTILLIANLLFFRNVLPLPAVRRASLVFGGLVLVGSLFMLVSKKSFTAYAVFFMYPEIMMLLSGARRPWVTLSFLLPFNTLLVIEPTLWFRLGGAGKALQDWIPHRGMAPVTIFLACELALIACYGYLTVLSVAYLRRGGVTVEPPATAVAV